MSLPENDHDFPRAAERVLAAAPTVADVDPDETREWLEALDAVVHADGKERAQYLYDRLADHALTRGVQSARARITPYRNTIPHTAQPPYPGDLELEARLGAAMRWNALAMVVRANTEAGELGGHIASYASAADLFEVGFHHFFKASGHPDGADLVYFQPHSSPGVYARAYLEGFLPEERLARYRREIGAPGLCSYPHPWLMPDFWQFPTGSMGLGPINAIYQARFLRYLEHRGLATTHGRRVWGFFGDGEMDEPESIGALSLAARERLDNLIFVINCNLQRLDGPVRGNSRVIDELEALFTGAGWNVIKVLRGATLDVLTGETMVIVGRSGEGKSVLLKHLIGLLMPDSGSVKVDGEEIVGLNERQLSRPRRKVGILFQNGALFDSLTVERNVAFPLIEFGERNWAEISKRVSDCLEAVDMAGHARKMPAHLSGGQRKRVALARALVAEPRCLLYDEPTAGLDPIATANIDVLIRGLQKSRHVTSVVVTHDLKSLERIADRVAFLREGKIAFLGSVDEFLNSPEPFIRDFVEGRPDPEQSQLPGTQPAPSHETR